MTNIYQNIENLDYVENLDSARMIMLDMLKVVHRICEDNNIRYWLDAGTLLGCVRHKGFIPWDDDIDIVMPREDFDKFTAIAQPMLPSDLFFQNRKTDPLRTSNITKIRKMGTKYICHSESGNEPYNQGIFIDIFPFDYYPSKWFTKWMYWTKTYRKILRNRYERKTLKRFLITIYTNIILFIPIKISQTIMNFLSSRHEKFFADPKMPVMGHRYSVWPVTGTYQTDIFPLKKELEFEGIKFYIPNNYHAYLTDKFGSDYMTPPPIEKRRTHAKKILLNIETEAN